MSKVIKLQRYDLIPIGIEFPNGEIQEFRIRFRTLEEQDKEVAEQRRLATDRSMGKIKESDYQIAYARTYCDFSDETEKLLRGLQVPELDYLFGRILEYINQVKEDRKKN